MKNKVAYCLMAQNDLYGLSKRIEEMQPYVDRIIVIDGGSMDDSIIYLRNMEGVEVYIRPWDDNFAEQRNQYLEKANTVGERPDWIIVSDADESFSLELRENLQQLIAQAETEGLNKMDIQCRLVYLEGEKIISSEVRPFWKPLFFKNDPGIYYHGSPHETIVHPQGWREKQIGDPYLWEHLKQYSVTWKRGARNFIVSGGDMLGDKNPHYKEFKVACKADLTPVDSLIINDLMVRGELGENVAKWIIDHKDVPVEGVITKNCASEMGDCYRYYYEILYPEKIEEV